MVDLKLRQINQSQQRWDLFISGTMILVIAGTTAGAPLLMQSNHWAEVLISASVGFMVSAPITLRIADAVNCFVRRRYIKGYYIQDCGHAVMLHGAVRLVDLNYAYRNLLAVRPGLRVIEDAYERFGCTLAAVPATRSELEAKRTVEQLGIPIRTIG